MLDSERVRWAKDNELLKTEEFLPQNWEERLQAEFVSKLLAVIKVQTTASLMLLYNSSLTKPESTLVIVPFFSAYLSIYYVHTLADTVVSARFFLCITYNVIVLHCVYVCQQSRRSVWKRPVQPTTAGYIMAISSLRSQRESELAELLDGFPPPAQVCLCSAVRHINSRNAGRLPGENWLHPVPLSRYKNKVWT